MTTDDRNFRSAYYEKVGCRSVEEKKSLEILLKDKPLNRLKLKQFCLSFTVPALHRGHLWNLLLGVAPVFSDSHAYVMSQRKAVYEDLLAALLTMRIINDKTPKPNVFHAMWLLENIQLTLGYNIMTKSNFVSIAEVLLYSSFESDVEVYWITKGFHSIALDISADLHQLKDLSYKLMEKEDNKVYMYLKHHNLLELIPLDKWYGSCFAGVLAKPSLIPIWDKICGGSKRILIFVFLILFDTLWRTTKLPNTTDISDILKMVSNLSENQETSDLIVNKSIELWQQNTEHTEVRNVRKTS